MSNTIVDMPKVAQMLDAGWRVMLFKNQMGSYTAEAHGSKEKWRQSKDRCLDCLINAPEQSLDRETLEELNDDDFDTCGVVRTDDFTPEQAITRLAYKVHGEII